MQVLHPRPLGPPPGRTSMEGGPILPSLYSYSTMPRGPSRWGASWPTKRRTGSAPLCSAIAAWLAYSSMKWKVPGS
jgi:hypothetical protein